MVMKDPIFYSHIFDCISLLQTTDQPGRPPMTMEEAIDIKQGFIDKNKDDKP